MNISRSNIIIRYLYTRRDPQIVVLIVGASFESELYSLEWLSSDHVVRVYTTFSEWV